MVTNSTPLSADLQGPLSGNGLHRLLLAAADRHMFASVVITGGPADGVIYLVRGEIALPNCHDIKTMRVAQHDLATLLRANAGSPVGNYHCAPLIDFAGAVEARTVTVHQALAATGALLGEAAPVVDSARERSADHPIEALSVMANVAAPTQERALVAPISVAAGEAPAATAKLLNEIEPPAARRVRASQLRKMLRERKTAPSVDVDPSVAAIAEVKDAPASREAALRSIIHELAAQ